MDIKPSTVPANTPDETERRDEEFFQDQLSGVGEKGVTNPPIKIPIKTYLKDVFLKTNPWHDRKLNSVTDELEKAKKQRMGALNWAQRQFFVSSVFDHDKLHFVTDTYTIQEQESTSSGKNKRGGDCDHFPSLKSGIFANTLATKNPVPKWAHHHAPRHNDDTLGNHIQPTRPEIPRTRSMPVLHLPRLSHIEQNAGEPCTPELTKRASLPDIKTKMLPRNSYTPRLKGTKKNVSTENKTTDDLQSAKDSPPQKATSLPNISDNPGKLNSVSLKGKENTPLRPLHKAKPKEEISRYSESSSPSNIKRKDELCDDKIIHRLFCTLPDHLKEIASVKSNEINRKLRKQMIAETKKKCNGDALLDKRWTALEQSLRQLNED